MANNIEKIDIKIQREASKLDALQLRKEEILKEISKCEKTIANLRAERKTAELGELGAIADLKGFSISEIYAAISNGDFYSLQEKFESNNAGNTASTETSYNYSDNVGGSYEEK